MPNPVVPVSSPMPTETATGHSPSGATPVLDGPRYQVGPVLWGTRKRFVVRDTDADTTVAIRTTSQIADSDLIRLNMRVVHGNRSQLHSHDRGLPPVPDDVAGPEASIVATERRCGRCRGVFPLDPTLDGTGLQDWWVCDPCHNKLFGTRSG